MMKNEARRTLAVANALRNAGLLTSLTSNGPNRRLRARATPMAFAYIWEQPDLARRLNTRMKTFLFVSIGWPVWLRWMSITDAGSLSGWIIPFVRRKLRVAKVARILRGCVGFLPLLLVQSVFPAPSATAATNTPAIKCTIDGVQKQFTTMAKAVYASKEGLSIMGFGEPKTAEMISLRVPVKKEGTFTFENCPGLSMHYSRSSFSSNSRDHFQANSKEKEAKLSITITNYGKVGQRVEGSFSAVVTTFPSGQLSITNGTFSVIREEPAKR